MAYRRIGTNGMDFTVAGYNGMIDMLENLGSMVIGRGIVSGLVVSYTAGSLLVSVTDGIAHNRSTIPFTDIPDFPCPTNSTSYLWLDEDGELLTTTTLSYPGNYAVCLGRVITDGVQVTSYSEIGRETNASDLSSFVRSMGAAPTTLTGNATLSKSDGIVLCSPTASMTVNLPLTTDPTLCPFPGQRFLIKDVSGLLLSGGYTITLTASDSSIDGVDGGSTYIYVDRGWVEILWSGTEYKVIRAEGAAGDLVYPPQFLKLSNLAQTFYSADTVTLPTSGNVHVGFIPFYVPDRCRIERAYLMGGNSTAASAGNARLQLALYDTNTTTWDPQTKLWNQTFDIVGGSNPTIQTSSTYDWMMGVGSFQNYTTDMAFTSCPILYPGFMYHLGIQFESTFTAGNGIALTRMSGLQTKRLAAGAQAFPYAWGASPSMSIQFSTEQVARPDMFFKVQRV